MIKIGIQFICQWGSGQVYFAGFSIGWDNEDKALIIIGALIGFGLAITIGKKTPEFV